MSWLRSALNRAAEVGNKTGLGRNLQKVAGSVYQQAGIAMDRGARFMTHNLSGKPYSNFKNAVRRLEDVALHARGEERQQAVVRWLGALRDLQRVAETGGGIKDLHREPSGEGEIPESPGTPKSEIEEGVHRANLVLFYDADISSEPMTFRDVFLRSLALENLVTSFIEEAPEDDEVQAVLEIFSLCLAGGPELHNAIMSGIQDLSKAAASYTEEVLVTRADLLKMARECVSGLKLSAEAEKLDAEVAKLRSRIELLNEGGGATASTPGTGDAHGNLGGGTHDPAHKVIHSKPTELFRLTARLQECLERKAALDAAGPLSEAHDKKVEEMRSRTVALQSAIAAMKKKIEENKQQKEDAVTYRGTKAKEVAEAEKVLSQEVMLLEQKREKLEAELAEVKSAISVATHRHINMQEEKEQFDEASSHMVAQLALAEQELSHSVEAHKTEAGVVATWQSFLEDTWVLQTGCHQKREKGVVEELKEARSQHLTATAGYLKEREDELASLVTKLEGCAAELEASDQKKKQMANRGMEGISADIESGKRKLEDKYLDAEARVKKVLASLEKVKEDVGAQVKRAEEAKQQSDVLKSITASLASLSSLREHFEGLKRPHIDLSLRQPTRVSGLGKAVPGKTKSSEDGAASQEAEGKGPKPGPTTSTGSESEKVPSTSGQGKDDSGKATSAPDVDGVRSLGVDKAEEVPAPSSSNNVGKSQEEKSTAKVEEVVSRSESDEVDDLFGDLDANTSAGAGGTDEDIEGWDLDE